MKKSSVHLENEDEEVKKKSGVHLENEDEERKEAVKAPTWRTRECN